jgi:D-alanyl-lipoteichoic acid acyltransferase DltB (MBOAT superfamily)
MLIASGFFRKAVVADNCALIANAAFNGKFGEPTLPVVLLGMYAFAWQIYGDFSGYSDMARGSAQLMGFHFMVNFRQPYLSCSLHEFWRRWHISLSSWLRDYLYIPLGGNRRGEPITYRNLMITMLLGGLWHGANWTFVLWGGIHGLWLSLERAAGKVFGSRAENSIPEPPASRTLLSPGAWLQRFLLFHLVGLTWILFRAPSGGDAVRFLKGLGRWSWKPEFGYALQFLTAFVVPLFLLDLVLEARNEEYLFETMPRIWPAVSAAFLSCAVVLFSANQINAFIYFQF